MARRNKPVLFSFSTPQYGQRPQVDERPGDALLEAQPESRREAVLEKLLRRAMRRVWTVGLPDDGADTIKKDRASVCRLLRMRDPLSERSDG